MRNRPPTRVYRVADMVAELAAQEAGEVAGPPAPLSALPSAPPPPSTPPEDRPTIAQEPAILGLSRHARSKLGSRLFVWFFVFVYAVILIQLVVALWQDA